MPQYWGGTRHFFLLILYNFKNIGGGARAPPAPLLRGLCSFLRIKLNSTRFCASLRKLPFKIIVYVLPKKSQVLLSINHEISETCVAVTFPKGPGKFEEKSEISVEHNKRQESHGLQFT